MSLSVINRGRSILSLVVVILALAATSEAQSVEQRIKHFQLFSNCRPMELVVENLHSDAAGIGLAKGAILASVESRLRSARLYDSDAGVPYLYVNVNVSGLAFSVDLEYNKFVFEPVADASGIAATWSLGLTGTHGRDASYILSTVSELMDLFLLEFLRVNDEAC